MLSANETTDSESAWGVDDGTIDGVSKAYNMVNRVISHYYVPSNRIRGTRGPHPGSAHPGRVLTGLWTTAGAFSSQPA